MIHTQHSTVHITHVVRLRLMQCWDCACTVHQHQPRLSQVVREPQTSPLAAMSGLQSYEELQANLASYQEQQQQVRVQGPLLQALAAAPGPWYSSCMPLR
jgi:hypothetical protein